DEVTSALRKRIESSEPALRVEFLGILSDLIGDLVSSPSPVEIRLFSEDAPALQRTARQVVTSIAKVSGVVDVFNGIVVSGPAITFVMDPQRAALYGVGAADVTARLENRDLGSAIAEIKSRLGSDVRFPAGITVEYGGLYEEQQSSFRELLAALALAVALVFLVLVIEFRSFAHPAAIVSGAVLALSGSLVALLITRTTLNVVSMMGLIMIVGIVSKNGILMLDTVDEHVQAGEDLVTALRSSGRRRFRPVLMTSL